MLRHLASLPEAEREREAQQLCAQHPGSAALLRSWIAGAATDSSSAESRLDGLKTWAAQASSRYVLQGEVARGGMGAVLRAYDQGLRRPLAMKVMLGAGGEASGATPPVDPQVLHRFLDEAQITGQLEHPGVVPVHELGVDAQGRAYFTMRLVRGRTAAEVFMLASRGEQGWNTTRALDVILKVCDTLAYAHGRGIVHRDIKPSNVMVGEFGEVYVMDWGLAKVLGQPEKHDIRPLPPPEQQAPLDADPQSPILTRDGAVLGTPCYMPPEQALGELERVGVRADVYATGALLYTLLAGAPPYLHGGQDPAPQAVLRRVQAGPPAALRQVSPDAPAELVAVCARAMARAPDDRYPDARALADDLRAFLERRVVKAYRTGAVAELQSWVRRHQLAAASLVLVLLALVAGVVVSLVYAEQSARSRYFANIAAAQAAYERQDPGSLRRFLDECPEHLRGWEWRYLDAASDTSLLVLRGHQGPVLGAVFSPDGKVIATVSEDRTGRLWDAESGKELRVLRGHTGAVRSVVFSPDGLTVWTASEDGTAREWRVGDGKAVRVVRFAPESAGVRRVDPLSGATLVGLWQDGWGAPDPESMPEPWLLADSCGVLVLTSVGSRPVGWNPATGGWWTAFPGGLTLGLASSFSSDRTLAAESSWEEAVVSRATDPTVRLQGHSAKVSATSFDRDGKRVVTAARDCTARIWDARSGAELHVLRGHTNAVSSASFSSDGSRVATTADDKLLREWDAATGRELALHRGHEGPVTSAVFDRAGMRIVTGSSDGSARVWAAWRPLSSLAMLTSCPKSSQSTFTGDGTRLVFPMAKTVQVVDAAEGRQIASFRGHELTVRRVASSCDGDRLVTVSDDGTVRVWESATGRELMVLIEHMQNAVSAVFSPDGRAILAATGFDRTARVVDTVTGRELVVMDHPAPVWCAVFSPDGEQIATACDDAIVRIHDARTGREQRMLDGHRSAVLSVAFSPDGRRLVTASRDGSVGVWDARTGQQTQVLRGPRDPVLDAAFSPDGSRIVTAGGTAVRLWDPDAAREILALPLPGVRETLSVAFSPDGTRLVGAGDEGARLWDSVPHRDRYREAQALHLAQAEAETVLARQWQCHREPTAVARSIRSASNLSPPVRRRALDLLLARVGVSMEQAARRVQLVQPRSLIRAEFLAAVEADPTLTGLARAEALSRVTHWPDDNADALYRVAWNIVKTPGAEPSRLREALDMARKAAGLTPRPAFVHTVGVALFRCGMYREAQAELERAHGLRKASIPEDLAFLAMTAFHLGDHAEARALLSALERESGLWHPLMGGFEDARAALAEARALIRGPAESASNR